MRGSKRLVSAGAAFLLASSVGLAHGSGPRERIMQVLTHPADPNIVVARYGIPDNDDRDGLLFSEDGGKTFRATCSDFIAKGLSLQNSQNSALSTLQMDGAGRLLLSDWTDQLFVGDASGCAFEKVAGFEQSVVKSLALDPRDQSVLYALVFQRDDAVPNALATSQVMRREGSGAWSPVGLLGMPGVNDSVYGVDLLVTSLPAGGVRMVAYYTVIANDATSNAGTLRVALSDDGGRTFREYSLPDRTERANFHLLAFDPTDADRVLALDYRKGHPDQLLISRDRGATYERWAEVDKFTGLAFSAEGRVFITSAEDIYDASVGGLFRADRIGAALVRLPGSKPYDCVHARGSDAQLLGCMNDKFGTLDPESGAFQEVTRLEKVDELLACPGKNTHALCEAQLNAGSSWCCAGHFPWTPFCGAYDVTMAGSRPVLCGRAGRAYDCKAGRGCGALIPQEGGSVVVETSPAGTERPNDGDKGAPSVPDPQPGANADGGHDGCSLHGRAGVTHWWLTLVALVGWRRRKQTTAPRNAHG
jgi:hypothetical protein